MMATVSARSAQVRRDQLNGRQWEDFSRFCEVSRRLKAKARARMEAARIGEPPSR
ncbi:MAG: hypothetical protein WCY68_14500 [Desulfuromonadales bacterium]